MKRRVLALIGVLVLTMSCINVSAADEVTIAGSTHSDSIPTSFTVTDEMLGGEVILSVPSEMILTQPTEGASTLEATGEYYAYGKIATTKHLELRVLSEVDYTLSTDNTVVVTGDMDMESPDDEDLALLMSSEGYVDAEYIYDAWTSDELYANKTAPVIKEMSAYKSLNDIRYAGVYTGTVTYVINVVDTP